MSPKKVGFIPISEDERDSVRENGEYVGSVKENDHDFYRDKQGLVLVNCQGDFLRVVGVSKRMTIRGISRTFEKQCNSPVSVEEFEALKAYCGRCER